jgi:hypothetical protein
MDVCGITANSEIACSNWMIDGIKCIIDKSKWNRQVVHGGHFTDPDIDPH